MTIGQPHDLLAFAFEQARALVRLQDIDRYYSVLFAPEDRRPYLFALYAFNIEISRIRDVVRDPLPGEVRLQWWRDLLLGEARGDVGANPLASALLATIKANRLPVEALVAMIEARSFDLYDDLMPTWHDLEGYCGETSSALIRLACIILEKGGDAAGAAAAGHAGLAVGFAGLLRNFPWHAGQGRMVLPQEALDHYRMNRNAVMEGRQRPELADALADMRRRAREHLAAVQNHAGSIETQLVSAFLPSTLVEPYLRQMERRNYQPFRDRVDLPGWRKLIILWRQAKRAHK